MKTIITTLIITLLSLTIFAQINAKEIDKIVEDEMIRQELPGIVVGVYKKGVINYTKGYGFLDMNRKVPITDNTVLNWASISKTLTAVAALQLNEKRDDFSIDDKVTKHYKHWTSKVNGNEVIDKERKEKIIIKQLLRHTSGIRPYGKKVWDNEKIYITDDDNFNARSCVEVFRHVYDLKFDPGTDYKYTTQGYNLLGAVIDKVSGSYPKWVHKNIKDKLGMSSLKISNTKAEGFKKFNGVVKSKQYNSTEWVLPGGGWESNVKDLLKFSKGILNEKLLKNTSVLWKTDSVMQYQGLENKGSGNNLRVYHGGSHPNLKSLMYIMPKKDIAVVIMIPIGNAERVFLVENIVNMLLGKNLREKEARNICGKKDSKSYKKFAAVWQSSAKDALTRRGYNYNDFYLQWKKLTNAGYQCTDIETYKINGKRKWDGIFVKQNGKNAMWRGFTFKEFKKKWDEMSSQGYRLIDIETYGNGSNRKWAGIFIGGNGKAAMYRNFSTKNFGKKYTELTKKGYKLIDIEAYENNGELKWAGVWREGQNIKLNRNFSHKDFGEKHTFWSKKGYKLIDVETYLSNGKRYWAGIWEKSNNSQKINRNLNFCEILKKNEIWEKTGHELIDLEIYN